MLLGTWLLTPLTDTSILHLSALKGWRAALNVLETMGVAMQNAKVEGQQSVLKPSYAKQRASAVGPVPDAVEVHHTLLASPMSPHAVSAMGMLDKSIHLIFALHRLRPSL